MNILYYGIEDRLREEADEAEYHHAMRQPKFDRLKFSLIGHPLCIIRLVFGLLPIICLLLPMGTVQYVLPFGTHSATVNLISIIRFFVSNGLDTNLLTKLFGSELVGRGIVFFAVSVVALALMMLIALVGFFLLTLSASPHGRQRNFAFPIAGIVCATVSFVGYILMIRALTGALPGIFTGTVNPLAYIAVVLCFVSLIVINVLFKKKGIQVKYTDVSEFLLPYNERPSTIEKKKARETDGSAEVKEVPSVN